MSKDSNDCEVMNELFGNYEDNKDMPKIHWHPVAIYNHDDTKIRDLTKEEQLAWIKKQKGKEK